MFFYALTENGGNATLAADGSIVAPCLMHGNDFTWGKKRPYNWYDEPSKLEGCCNVFRTIFDTSNIQQIMSIMKHTIGMPLPFRKFNKKDTVAGSTDRLLIPNHDQL